MAAPESLKRSRSSAKISFNDAPVKVVVGPEKTVFHVHASALTSSSEFLKSALKEEWRKSHDSTIDLQDYSPEIFTHYVRWLYSDAIAGITLPEDYESANHNYISLVKLYALGEHINDIKFQDFVIDAIIAQSRHKCANGLWWCPTGSKVNVIYENTSSSSPARRLMVDLHVRFGLWQWIRDDREDDEDVKMNHEFLVDLSRALLKDRELLEEKEGQYAALEYGAACKYHNHDKDKPCH